jgi:hypothetical protein
MAMPMPMTMAVTMTGYIDNKTVREGDDCEEDECLIDRDQELY